MEMDDESALGVGFAIETGGSFDALVQIERAMESTEARVVADAAKIERATSGMVNARGAVAGISAFGNAATREMRTAAQETKRVEKAGEALVRQLERQNAAYGLTREELRQLKAEEKALAAERVGNSDLAMRLRATEAAIFEKELAAARRARFEAEAAAEEKQRAADLATAAAAREAAAIERQAAAAQRLAREHGELAAMVRGSAAAQQADAVAAERLRASTDPLYAATKRLNQEIAESTRLYHLGETAPAEYARQQRVLQERLRQTTAAQQASSTASRGQAAAFTQLSFQLNDVATMGLSGASAFQILATQGGQIFQVFQMAEGGAAGLAKEIGALLLRFAPLIGITAVVATGALAWLEYSNAMERFNGVAKGQGRILGFTADQLEQNALAAANAADISVAAARDIEVAYAKAGKIAAGVLVELIGFTNEFARATGQDATDAAQELGAAFGDPIEGAQQLAEKYGAVSQSTVEYIGKLVEQGDMLGAQKVLLNALEPAFDGAADHANVLARGWDNIKNAASGAWEWMGKAIDRMVNGGTIAQKIADVQIERSRAAGMGVTDFSTFDKQLADLRRQLQVQEVLTARAQENAKQQAGAKVVEQFTGSGVLSGYQKAAGDLRAALATDMPRDQREQMTQALNAYTHAIDSFIPRQEKANQLAAIDARIAAAKTPAQKAALAAERERLSLAGEVITSADAEARALVKGEQARARTHQAVDRHAQQLVREAEATEAQIRNLYALGDAYKVSGADALIAEARVKAESAAITKRANVDEAVARQVRLVIAQRVSDASKSAASIEDQVRAQAAINDEVAAGNVPAARANELIRDRIADLPLLDALEAARRIKDIKGETAIADILDRQRKARIELSDVKRTEQMLSMTQGNAERIEELREELRLVGATEAVRVRALATLKATQELARGNFTGKEAANYIDQQVKIADLTLQRQLHEDALNRSLHHQAELLDIIADNVARAAGGMADAFGSVGQAIGEMSARLADYIVNQERLKGARNEELRQAAQIGDVELRARREREIGQQFGLRNSTAQIALFGDLTAAAKGFFKEGSSGYRALQKAEQTFRAIQFALSVRAMVQDVRETASAIVNSGLRTAKHAVEAVVKAISSLPFPLNLAAGAATAAAIASLGVAIAGSFGGSSRRPETNTGTGTVFGDSDAKSESIKRSIDALKEVDTLTNTYAREMMASLRSIDSQIGGFAALILRTGDINASAGVDTGFKMDTTGSLLKGIITGGGLFSKIPIIGGIIGGIGSLIGSLFGSKTKVVGSGLFGGPQSIGSILSGGFDAQYFSDIQKKKKFLGITTGTSYSTQFSAADPALESQFTLILRSFNDAIAAAAGPLGVATSEVQRRLNSFVVNIGKIDLQGLTGEQIQEKLTAVFGAAADRMANAAFPGMARFQKVGEGLFETIVRVASTVEAVTNAMGMLGGSVQNLSIDAKMGLAELFDSVSALTNAAGAYFERFYTQEEQVAARTVQLQRVFTSLGITMPDTLAAFRALVEGQNLNTEAGRSMYATLLQLAPAFADLQQSMNGARSAADILSERQDLERKLLEVQGDTVALRALDLAKLDASNRALQEQIWALQDAQEAAKAADELRKAWTDVGTSIMDEVKRIRGLTDPAGDNSFASLSAQFNAATAAARAGDQDAARSLPGLSQAMLKVAADMARSRQELERVQAQTAASLEETFAAINGLATPSSGTSTAGALVAALAAAQGSAAPAGSANDNMASEIADLRDEIAAMRADNNAGHAATAGNTAAIKRTLDNVTLPNGGDAISVANAA